MLVKVIREFRVVYYLSNLYSYNIKDCSHNISSGRFADFRPFTQQVFDT